MLGSHVPTQGGLQNGVRQGSAWGCECLQLYTTPSRSWMVPDLMDEACAEFLATRTLAGDPVVLSHVPFLVNPCIVAKEAWLRACGRLALEVKRAGALRLNGVVLHPGYRGNSGRDEALRRTAACIANALSATDTLDVSILIENMAGQGTTLCAQFEDLAELLRLVGPTHRVGVCFDTAHAFAAGHPLSRYDGYDDVMSALESIVGLDRVRAIHLNDSA